MVMYLGGRCKFVILTLVAAFLMECIREQIQQFLEGDYSQNMILR
jgi:hypothetical protein